MNEKTFRKMYTQEEIKAIANDSVVTSKTGCRRMWTEEEIKAIAGGGGGGGDTTTVKNLLDATKSCYYLFRNYKGTSIDDLIQPNDTSNVTNMEYMFNQCSYLTSIPKFDTSKVTNMHAMFFYCIKLSTIPLLDTSNVTNMSSMFNGCSQLTSIPALNVSNVVDLSDTFNYCSALEEIHMTGMKVSFNISASTKFTRAALVEILNNLATITSTYTLRMGATNLAKLTNEDKAIATNKGWTLA